MHASKEEKSSIVLPSVTSINYSNYHHGKIYSRVHSATYILGVNNSLLVGLKATQQEETHAWYCKLSQLPMVGEVMHPRRERITATYSNQYNSLLCSKHLLHTHR